MKTAFIITVVVLVLAGQAGAGVLAPALEAKLDAMSEQDLIKVLVVMQDESDIRQLDKTLHLEHAPLAERHLAVVSTLQDAAAVSQVGLLKSLAADKALGGIVGFKPYWIVNGVAVTGTVAAIRDLATRSDVRIIEPDLTVELIEPVSIKPVTLPRGKGTAGFTSSGVKAIGAPRVWHELGIDGTGTLVANMDSGVDATHPALAGRWRGNFASAAESWQDVAGSGSPSFPVDGVGHGTHVMGTITGASAFDTTGVAPGAQWIASNAIAVSSGLDIAVIAAFEWLADPDGDPNTTDDVPDVCHNSWGVPPAAAPDPCDTTFWEAIDNCEAAGVVVTFSAGNEGPDPGTLRFPGNRATSPTNCFTVGSTSAIPPYVISQFSSRGPSQCGGPYAIKPEVTAPGESIYSSVPGGGYAAMDGTSMAGPHVAGLVALMRQAAPDLDVITIKEVLMSTAIDKGNIGEDNDYGHGFIDAYAAVLSVMGNAGTVAGVITDQTTGLPLAGATIADTRGSASTVSAADGSYSLTVLAGAATFRISAFSYGTSDLVITIPGGGSLNLDVALAALPSAVVSGTVRDADGQLLAGATITALGTPLAPVITGALGTYQLTLPAGEDVAYDILALAPNLAYSLQNIGLQIDQTLDFNLPLLQTDGFESGGFATFPWQASGSEIWTVGTDQAYEGVMSARSGSIADAGLTELSVDFYVQGAGELKFRYKVDSEELFDTLKFFVDGTLQETWSGAIDWSLYTLSVPTGAHTFQWIYAKDEAASVGLDAAWIDLVEFPGTGVQPTAAVTLSETLLSLVMDAGTTTNRTITLGNVGSAALDFTAVAVRDNPATPAWLSVTPGVGTIYPGSVKTLTVDFDASLLWAGAHTADLVISSNDPAYPDTVVAVELAVAPVSAVGDGLPRHLVFQGAVPNPFNPATDIRFSLPRTAQVELGIYDVGGHLVRTLVSGVRAAGPYSERWNGQDDAGRNVASGVFFARLRADGEIRIKRMALVR